MGKTLIHVVVALTLSTVCFLVYNTGNLSEFPKDFFVLGSLLTQFFRDNSINQSPSLTELPEYTDFAVYNICMIRSKLDEEHRSAGYTQHGFNEFVSEKIGFHRNVPDTRNPECRGKKYKEKLPTASIIMCFYNEAWSTLLRSVHNILHQTPSHLLKDIILFDDNSSHDFLGSPLEEYVKTNLTKVKLRRSKERLGLIRARMAAARYSEGEVLVFLDSHIEAVEMWLEPLLDRIASSKTTVVVPVVDTIEAETFKFTEAKLVQGGFTWSLLHNWEPLPDVIANAVKRNAEPFRSPTMPGGLFAIDKKYFLDLGEYDAGMDIWGGENVEISFRIWQCGGRLEIVPCSRVGHVFRKFRPYTSPDGRDTTTHNTARVAEVWLDEFKEHYYKANPKSKNVDFGDVSGRIELRKRLGCKSFRWFLDNVHLEQAIPGERPGAGRHPPEERKEIIIAQGQIKHISSNLCVHSASEVPTKEDHLTLGICEESSSKEEGMFVMTKDNTIKVIGTRLCLETFFSKSQGGAGVKLSKCHMSGGEQLWLFVKNMGHKPVMYNPASGKCLSVSIAEKNQKLRMDICASQSTQHFQISGLKDEHLISL